MEREFTRRKFITTSAVAVVGTAGALVINPETPGRNIRATAAEAHRSLERWLLDTAREAVDDKTYRAASGSL